MSYIRFVHIIKQFSDVQALNGIDFEINKGEFVTFLGPSGCGKTTMLRCLAGLEEPEVGEIWVGNTCIFSRKDHINLPPGSRGVGLVFQNYALWPHMTVEQNILFGLRKVKITESEKKKKIDLVLKAMNIENYACRYPHELSGGQQQRVAVARMIVTEPGILLFDEPLSNLDAKLRMKLRSELKMLHKTLGATTVYVTHDQIEALALSDKIVVMKDGTIQQVGNPYEVYHHPNNTFVADFMGNPETNLLSGTIKTKKDGQKCFYFENHGEAGVLIGTQELNIIDDAPIILNVRPEDIILSHPDTQNDSQFYVYAIQPMGSEMMIHLQTKKSKKDIIAKGPEDEYLSFKHDQSVTLRFKRGNIFEQDTGNLICSFKE